MPLSCRVGTVLLPLLLVLLLTLVLLSYHHNSLPDDSRLPRPARSESMSLDVFTHIKTKLKLPESRILDFKPSRETTQILVPNDKIIVMARLSEENTDWVSGDLADWRHMIYTVDKHNVPNHTPINKGRESLAYLKYIVDHYDDLPSTIVFLHPHKIGYPQAWHIDNPENDNAVSVRNLQLDFVQRNGYANLRCQHSVGCPVSVRPSRRFRDRRTIDGAYADAWEQLFNSTRVPKTIGVPCCSQFAVSRNQVLQRPLSDYRQFYLWVLENDLPDDVTAGIMESTWHIIFGQDPMYCPDEAQCYEDVYGTPSWGRIADEV